MMYYSAAAASHRNAEDTHVQLTQVRYNAKFCLTCAVSDAETEARAGGFQGAHEKPKGAEDAETDGHAV